MPPVPIYTQSPINAAKASGVTPQTATPSDKEPDPAPSATTTVPTRTEQGYPAAQPGAVPSLPVATGSSQRYAPSQPTTTSKPVSDQGPPPPQPGAVPVPPGARNVGPPPPTTTAAPSMSQHNMPPPPQMSIPAPTVPIAQRGTMAATAPPRGSQPGQLNPLGQASNFGADSLAHPPGYQQNVNASEFSNQQRTAHEASFISSDGVRGSASADGEDEGMWTSAMKWAQTAGEKLSAAESEVWKRINKE